MSLINKLPFFYEDNIVKGIQDSLTVEADLINNETNNTLNQLFINTSTHGLSKWEKMIGIKKNNFDFEVRRENIKAKLRSRGTTTFSVIKNICESYSYGEVEIIVNHSDYSFIIDFIGTKGIPYAFEELDKTINEIKPCHLAHTYKFNYNTNKDIANYTHGYLSKYTHEEIRVSNELRGVNNE